MTDHDRLLRTPTRSHRVLSLACLLLGVLLGGGTASGGPAEGVFRAGAFAMDITPTKFPISVNGGFQDRMAARSTTGSTPAAWCSTTARRGWPSSSAIAA